MQQSELATLAKRGSPTARQLMEQMEREAADADAAAKAQRLDEATSVARQRQEQAEEVRQRALELLDRYDALRREIEPCLLALAKLDRAHSLGSAHRLFPDHLRKVHIPPATLGRLEPLHPVFTSMEALLLQLQATGQRGAS